MRELYPELEPYETLMLDVDSTHSIYVEQCGNAKGLPVLFIHGGPGGGTDVSDRRFFDPARYRIILFHQRGTGKSTPFAELENNTTQHLVGDIEKIRERLGIEKWVVFGGSWGSSLSLVYAEAQPRRVLGIVVRGIFLCRDEDFDWAYQRGAPNVFTDHYQEFIAPIPESERNDLLRAYHKRLTADDEEQRMRVAKAWSLWEARVSTLKPNPDVEKAFSEPDRALAIARLEAHYFVNRCFLEPDQILRDAHRIADIPGTIVHGRYDIICPFDAAWLLSQAWPKAELHVTPDAGHSAKEPGNIDALVQATDALADRYYPSVAR